MLIRTVLISTLIVLSTKIQAQLPNCNLYHFTIQKASGQYTVKNPLFLTAFNMDGYNNQVAFFGDDIVYFTTNYYDSSSTEIAKFDLFQKVLERITYTSESEYSPKPLPSDKSQFSCVRVEADGVTQTMQTYPLDGLSYGQRILAGTDNIGYYAWTDKKSVALFLVSEPSHQLAIADTESGKKKIVLDKIGRSLIKGNKSTLYFIHKVEDELWYLKALNIDDNRISLVTQMPKGVEDIELLPDGSFLCANGTMLLRFDPETDTEWGEIANLEPYGLHQITRIAVNKNRLILVDTKP